jgi:hypothetical protein
VVGGVQPVTRLGGRRRGNRQIDEPMPVKRPHRFLWFTWGEGDMPKRDYRDTPLFKDGIGPGDVNQGAIGNCYFIAALAAMAATAEGQRRIREMIRDNGDGTFTVTFADGTRVTVDDDFYVDQHGQPLYARPNGDIWAAILEEAYARKHGSYGKIEIGFPHDALNDLGLRSQRSSLDGMSDHELERVLSSGGPLCLSGELDRKGGITSSYDGRHAFSVAGTERSPTGELLIRVRNPWGHNEGLRFPSGVEKLDDGTIICTVAQIKAMFRAVSHPA